MIVFFIILGALIVVGAVLYLTRDTGTPEEAPTPTEAEASNAESEECCGAHAICEKGLPPSKPIYFDDEELDRYAGRSSDSYTPTEADDFRDVLLTLLPSDIVPWTQSIEMRHIELPDSLRDELLMLITDTTKAS